MYKIKLKHKLQFFVCLFKYATMNNFNVIWAIPLTIFTKSKFKNSTKIRENFSSLFQMWDTKSSTLAIDKSAAGRIDRPQRRSGKCNRGRSSGISPRKVYGWNFGQRVKEGGKPGADGKNRLSRGARKRRVRIGKGCNEYRQVYTCPRWHFRDKVDS